MLNDHVIAGRLDPEHLTHNFLTQSRSISAETIRCKSEIAMTSRHSFLINADEKSLYASQRSFRDPNAVANPHKGVRTHGERGHQNLPQHERLDLIGIDRYRPASRAHHRKHSRDRKHREPMGRIKAAERIG